MMRKHFALMLAAALLLVLPSGARALTYGVDAPISYALTGGESPTTTEVAISWDGDPPLTYIWTNTGTAWEWVPSALEVEFTVTNNSVCNDATVGATLDGVSYGGKAAADFSLDGASIGLSGESEGALGDSASTGRLACRCYEGEELVGEAGVGYLYYAIRPAAGAGLTPEELDQLRPAAVTATITFQVTMDSSLYEGE